MSYATVIAAQCAWSWMAFPQLWRPESNFETSQPKWPLIKEENK